MPIQITCSGCDTSFTVASKYAGQLARCKLCGDPIEVPIPEVQNPAAIADGIGGANLAGLLEEELPGNAIPATDETTHRCAGCGTVVRRDAVICIECGLHQQSGKHLGTVDDKVLAQRDKTRVAGSLLKVRIGLEMIFWSLAAVLSIFLAIIALGFICFGSMISSGSPAGAIALLLLIGGLMLIGVVVFGIAVVLSTVGRFFCLMVPKEVGGRGMVIAGIACEWSALALLIMGVAAVKINPFFGLLFFPLCAIAIFSAPMFFAFFMKKLAYYLRYNEQGDDAMTIFGVGIRLIFSMIAVSVLGTVVVYFFPFGGAIVVGLVKLGILIGWLWLFYSYMRLLWELKAVCK